MLLASRTAIPFLAFTSLVAAIAPDQSPAPGGALLRREDGSEIMQISRRSLGDTLACLLGNCNYVNTNTDVNNCGKIGTVCPTSYANGAGSVFCSSGVCQSACSSGFAFSTAVAGCVNTNYDPNNCGTVGRVCSFTNAVAACTLGSCTIASCNTGSKLVSGSCQTINTANDVSNCGTLGNVCTAATGVATASCVSSKCVVATCASGYTLTSGSCTAINTATSTSNCGTIGNACPATYNNGLGTSVAAICSGGICQPTACATGYGFDTSTATCRNILTDSSNCGAIGTVCSFSHGSGSCVSGKCTTSSCSTGYKLTNGACVSTTASQRARVKKSKISGKVELCPGSETACPIAGSASFLVAQSSGFSAFRLPDLASMVAEGGYECLDTQYAIESCGGCASMGEGKNCLSIPRAAGVGCNSGTCVVFSCEEGYKPNFDSSKCVKASPTRNARRGHARRGHGITSGHLHAHASS